MCHCWHDTFAQRVHNCHECDKNTLPSHLKVFRPQVPSASHLTTLEPSELCPCKVNPPRQLKVKVPGVVGWWKVFVAAVGAIPGMLLGTSPQLIPARGKTGQVVHRQLE